MTKKNGFKSLQKAVHLVFLIGTMALVLLLSTAGIAFADTTGPAFTTLSPADGAQGYFIQSWSNDDWSTSWLPFSVVVDDPDGILNGSQSVSVKYNGSPVTAYFTGFTYTAGSNQTQATISYELSEPYPDEAKVEITFSIKDKPGNTSTRTWRFTQFSSYPTVDTLSPTGLVTDTMSPTVSAHIGDYPSGVDLSKVVLKINGQPVTPTLINTWSWHYNAYYTPPAPYDPGTHTVELWVSDNVGITTYKTWTFSTTDTNLYPYPGLIREGRDPMITARITDADGIDGTFKEMTIDGSPVLPSIIRSANDTVADVSYQSMYLWEGNHNVTVRVKDKLGNFLTRSWTFTLVFYPEEKGGPWVSSWSPSASVVYGVPTTGGSKPGPYVKVSAYGYDPQDGIYSGFYKLTGITNTPTFKYTGVTFPTQQALLEGEIYDPVEKTYTVTAQFKDMYGNLGEKTWSFGVNYYAPTITGTATNVNTYFPTISINVFDQAASKGATINPSSIVATLDKSTTDPTAVPLPLTITGSGGNYTATYVPTTLLAEGWHTVYVTAADNWGWRTYSSFSFKISEPPVVSNLQPAENSTTNMHPRVSAHLADNGGLASWSAWMSFDGLSKSSTFAFVPNSTKEADIYFDTGNLSEGTHTAKVNIQDDQGNVTQKTWTFNVIRPIIANTKAPMGITNNKRPPFSVNLRDDQINAATISTKINGSDVAYNYDAASGTVSFTPQADLADGTHTVQVSVNDKWGATDTVSWNLTIDTLPPSIDTGNLYPTGRLTSLTYWRDTFFWNDPQGMIDLGSVTLKANGTPVPVSASDDSGIDTDNPYSGRGRINGYNFTPGIYNMEATISDTAGNKATATWTFYYNSIPTFSGFAPVDKQKTVPLKPTISVKATDPFGGTLDASSVKMWLNNQPVTPSYTAITSTQGMVSYAVPEDLANEAFNTVKVLIADNIGEVSETQWTFETATYPDMEYTNNAVCGTCHAPNTADGFNSMHIIPDWRGHEWGVQPCYDCHAARVVPGTDLCGICHTGAYLWGTEGPIKDGHGGQFAYTFENRNDSSLYELNGPRENFDCFYCHQGQQKTQLIVSDSAVSGHDYIGDHKVSFPDEGCRSCHAQSLTREHARPDRLDLNGQGINCQTCHSSNTARVKNAVEWGAGLILKNIGNNSSVDVVTKESPEKSFAGKMVKGARLVTKAPGTIIVYGYNNDTWNEVYSKTIDANNATLDITITPSSKIKIKTTIKFPGQEYFTTTLDNWVYDDPGYALTCTTCHVESNHNLTGKTDSAPPVTTALLAGTVGNNGWYVSDVQVTLNATDDASGIDSTKYSSDGIFWFDYSGPLTVSAEGVTTVFYKSVDKAGNVEATKEITINIDKTAPTITGAPTTAANENGWYNSDVTVHFSATDNGSGIASITPDTTLTQEGADLSVVRTVVDLAGNSASYTVGGINIDKSAPQVVISTPANGGEYNLNQIVSANWSATDAVSGIASASGTTADGAAIDTATGGAKTYSVTATDLAGNRTVEKVSYYVNTPPAVAAGQTGITVNEGDLAINSGIVGDVDNDTVTLSASIGNITDNGDGTWSWSLQAIDGPSDSQTLTITALDENGNSSETTFDLTVSNTAANILTANANVDPTLVNTPISAIASFSDQGNLDTHTAVIDWGDGTTSAGTVTEANGHGTVNASHIYAAAGVYTLTITVTDNDGAASQYVFSQYVVIYDPAAGFVTGGGWINSPAGAYTADPSLTGKASFGFNSKYKNGAGVPDGQTEFQFKAGNLNFHSSSYEWLVISGAKAQYKGTGTINGIGNYKFILTVIDGQVNGGGGVDKFRIRIYDETLNKSIYDNHLGAADTEDPTTSLAGGSIVIHKQ